ncbi:hypothetical protein HU200_009747 [Digitaria exilis]|uniref:HMA domain-containing protein n=1 Tax=Digitaria exilis TaxID=1010633 RepID=A0A835FKD7_9POAL|nr:hypothetical protein HU200_009747 [Digitaria exilis]
MRDIMAVVAKLQGIKSMTIDADKCTLTVTGTVDPVCIVQRLRKKCFSAFILSVEDVKPPEPPKPPNDPCKEKCEKLCKDKCERIGCKECRDKCEKACQERCERRCNAWLTGSSCSCGGCRTSSGWCHTSSYTYCWCGRGCGGGCRRPFGGC